MREFFIRNRVLPARNPDKSEPRKGRPIAELNEELVSGAEETAALLAANPGLNYRRMTLRHPLLGTNDVMGLLRMLTAHEERHLTQIRGLLRRAPEPSEASV